MVPLLTRTRLMRARFSKDSKMSGRCSLSCLVAAMLLPAVGASAQQNLPIGDALPPTWDVAASVGLFTMGNKAIDADQRTAASSRQTQADDWTAPTYRVGVGRYWTSHFKTDFGFAVHGPHDTFDVEIVPMVGLPNGARVFTDKRLDLTTASAAATYQFRENAYVHPYASAGIQVGWRRDHRFRDRRVYTEFLGPFPATAIRYTALPLDEHNDILMTRPFVAGGTKLYFSRRVFIRPEAVVLFGPSGVSAIDVHAGAGIDW